MTRLRAPKIEGAEMILYFDSGDEVSIDLSPAMIEIIAKSCGVQIAPAGDGGIEIARYDDRTIRDVMQPRLEGLVKG